MSLCSLPKSQELAKKHKNKLWMHKRLRERKQELKENGDKNIKGRKSIKKKKRTQNEMS